MNKQKLIIFNLFNIFLLSLVSAQYSRGSVFNNLNLGDGMRQLIDQAVLFITPIFEYVLGEYSGGELFFAKSLFLILLVVIIFVITQKLPLFEDNKPIGIIVSLIISSLSVRFLSENDYILGILLPYTTLGIVISSILPLMVFVYFTYQSGMSGLGRKMAWIFFGVTFFVLWYYRYDEIGNVGNTIYIITMIISAIFLVFDRKVAAYFGGMDIREFEKSARDSEIVNLQNQLSSIIAASRAGTLSPHQERMKKTLEKKLHHLGAKYSRY